MSARPNGSMGGIHPRYSPTVSDFVPCRDTLQRLCKDSGRRTLTSSVLEREAALVHLVLLDVPTGKMVHVTRAVDLHLELGRVEGPLLTDEDVEVVIGGVHACVALGADGGAEDDEVLGNAGVDDVHGTHGAAGVVKHPLARVGVERDLCGGIGCGEVLDDEVYHRRRVIWLWCCGNGSLCELVQFFGVEDVPTVLIRRTREHWLILGVLVWVRRHTLMLSKIVHVT